MAIMKHRPAQNSVSLSKSGKGHFDNCRFVHTSVPRVDARRDSQSIRRMIARWVAHQITVRTVGGEDAK